MLTIRLAALIAAVVLAIPAKAANPWTVSTTTSPSTGITTTTLQNATTDGALVVFCTSNGTRGYYLSTTYATANGTVRYRIGPGALLVETWTASPGPGGQTLSPSSVDLSLLRQIYQNWDVVFQYNAQMFGARTLQINASGFSEVIDQTRAACNWSAEMLPPDNGWGKPLPTAAPVNAREADYSLNAFNQFRLFAWRGHAADGKPQLLARLGDRAGPCVGTVPINDHRLYVTQAGKVVSAVSGKNFETDCSNPVIVALNGDFDAGKAFTLFSYSAHDSAVSPGVPIATIVFDDQTATIVTLVEYYNAALDHYFMTWVPAEIAVLDAGLTIKGWVRTGQTIPAYVVALMATSGVCRYYIIPALGDSHFYGRGVDECAETGRFNPRFILEDPAFFQMYMPAQGVCPPGTIEVYRVFSNRLDANHRYMIDKALRDFMVSRGWRAEGDGPNLVVMCAPV